MRTTPSLRRDLDDLRTALHDQRFPAQQDDLIAACLGAHVPVRLCSRLAALPRTDVYHSLDEVLDALAALS
jgi:hypothetical protein